MPQATHTGNTVRHHLPEQVWFSLFSEGTWESSLWGAAGLQAEGKDGSGCHRNAFQALTSSS